MARGHGHGYGSREDRLEIPERTSRLLYGVAAGLAVLTLAEMVLLRPTGDDRPDLTGAGFGGAFFDATVSEINEQECPGRQSDQPPIRCATIASSC